MENEKGKSTEELKAIAKEIRRQSLIMTNRANSGHPGGSLSCAEIMAVLFFRQMRYDARNPKWADRERFVMSKGHATPALYAAMAEAGFFPKEELKTYRQLNSRLQGHSSVYTPGIEICTGSLGQGLSVGNGMALAAKLDNKEYKVYVIMGDGELQEGEVWEAAKSAAHYRLDNVTAIVDRNGLQQNGPTEKLMRIEPLADKFMAFGWHTIEVDGHNVNELINAFELAGSIKGKPKAIIAKTVKGKGVSFMENVSAWHGKAPNEEQLKQALEEVEAM
ncbi:transketolase [Candidatus Woesearchaeota archaeon]|nr:transketolase [Candidatus Woesearchaeota archaeon]